MAVNLPLLLTLGVLVCAPDLSFQQQCATSNDIGGVSCVLLTPYYSEYQWATCLTEDYIVRVSDNRHQCRSDLVTQCWYQCMLEIHGLDQGPVYEGCRCSPGEVITEAPTDVIPSYCYSPSGDDCSWYRNCLEVRYPCEDTNDAYAIRYAEKFCNLYGDNYNDFSGNGKAWIDGVRKCLQVALVPSLRPWVQKTCSDIRTDALASHPDCYTNPSNRAPGICALPCSDALNAFWLVAFEGGALFSAPTETATQMWIVMRRCFGEDQLSGCIPDLQRALEFTIKLNPTYQTFSAAAQVATFLASAQNWISNGLRWILLNDDDSDIREKRQLSESESESDSDVENDSFSVKLLLADVKVLNTTNGTAHPSTQGQTLNEAIENLSNAVQNGDLSDIPLIVDNIQIKSQVLSMGQCADALCNSTDVKELATAPPPSSAEKPVLFVQLYCMNVISMMVVYLFMTM